MAVKYLTNHAADVKFIKKPVPRRGMMQLAPGQGQDGYGRKISTDYMAIFDGRRHRVYCCCISNTGSLYVIVKGEWLHVGDYDIPDSVRNPIARRLS